MEKRPTSKDIIQVLNAVDKMEANGELLAEMQCKDKSLVVDSTVSNELILHSITEDVSNIKPDGTVLDMKKSRECLLPTLSHMVQCGNQNHQEAAKESSETQQASDRTSEIETRKELRLDKQCTDKLLVLNTTASKDLAPQSVSGEMFIDKTDGKVADEVKFDESFSAMLTFSESSTSYQNYQEGAHAFSEPQSACATTTETQVTPGSNVLLDVYPLELSFQFEPNKLIACSLDLRNNTEEQVAFRLLKKSDEQTCFLSGLPLFDIVDPGSTYTLIVIMNKHNKLPQERNVDLILQASTCYEILSDSHMLILQNAEEVTLKGVCALPGETTFERLIPPSIKIIAMEKYDYNISSIDANQTEPLIITCCLEGNVHIWNYDTQKSMGSVTLPEGDSAWDAKFIARKGWFLVGSHNGFIHVYSYGKEMRKIASFQAQNRYICLAIHPTKSYVLSASCMGIKLWDWDQKGRFGHWKCMRTFEEHLGIVCAVAFIPKDYNSFATSSWDGAIKVWNLDSPKSKYTLSGHLDSVNSLDFFTRGDGQQYLITGSHDRTAKIWDMQMKVCVRILPHRSAVYSVLPHPSLPVLVTGTQDGHVYMWSSINYRLKRILNISGFRRVIGLACLMESGRVAIPHYEGVSVIEIRDEE